MKRILLPLSIILLFLLSACIQEIVQVRLEFNIAESGAVDLSGLMDYVPEPDADGVYPDCAEMGELSIGGNACRTTMTSSQPSIEAFIAANALEDDTISCFEMVEDVLLLKLDIAPDPADLSPDGSLGLLQLDFTVPGDVTYHNAHGIVGNTYTWNYNFSSWVNAEDIVINVLPGESCDAARLRTLEALEAATLLATEEAGQMTSVAATTEADTLLKGTREAEAADAVATEVAIEEATWVAESATVEARETEAAIVAANATSISAETNNPTTNTPEDAEGDPTSAETVNGVQPKDPENTNPLENIVNQLPQAGSEETEDALTATAVTTAVVASAAAASAAANAVGAAAQDAAESVAEALSEEAKDAAENSGEDSAESSESESKHTTANPPKIPSEEDDWEQQLQEEIARPRSELNERFDQYADKLERILHELPDGNYDQLDEIVNRVANQGGASVADMDEISRLTREAWRRQAERLGKNADDWKDIANHAWWAGLPFQGIAAIGKAAATGLDPTKGLIAGVIYGSAENRGSNTTWGEVVASSSVSALFNAGGNWVAEGGGYIWQMGVGGVANVGEAAVQAAIKAGGRMITLADGATAFVFGAIGGAAGRYFEGPSGANTPEIAAGRAPELEGGTPRVAGSAEPNINTRPDADVDAPLTAPRTSSDIEPSGAPASADVEMRTPPPIEGDQRFNDWEPETRPPAEDIPDTPQQLQDLQARVTANASGEPEAALDDVLAMQQDSRLMRTLKDADPETRSAFNRTLRRDVYEPHDAELIETVAAGNNAQVQAWLERNAPGASAENMRVHDFRSPGQQADPAAINTDRDFRMLVTRPDGQEIEIPKELWQEESYRIFGRQTGFDAQQVRSSLPESELRRLDQLTPARQQARLEEIHAERFQQVGTDRHHIEASLDRSDQHFRTYREVVDPDTGRTRLVEAAPGSGGNQRIMSQVEANEVNVKNGNGTLIDADGFGRMYDEKIANSLRSGNMPEAVAQAKKAVDSLRGVRNGYAAQNFEVGVLPDNLQKAMTLINRAPVDHRATPAQMQYLNEQLAELNFPGGLSQVSRAMHAQFNVLQFAKQN